MNIDHNNFIYNITTDTGVDRDSAIGTTTRYGLDGPGVESRWGRDFPHPSRPTLWAHPASCKIGTVSFAGVKRPGRDADNLLYLAPNFKKE